MSRQTHDFNTILGPIVKIVGCQHCGTGIAIAVIAERYNEDPPTDWTCKRETCEVSKRGGASESQAVEIDKLVQALKEPAPLSTPTIPAEPDSRLPPEKDEEKP